MKNFNTQSFGSEQADKQSALNNNVAENKNKINEVLTSKLEQEFNLNEKIAHDNSIELWREWFGLSEKEIQKLTKNDTKELEYSMEVTQVTADLWNELQNRLWLWTQVTDKLMAMNEKSNKPFSVASVMASYDEYEEYAA